ncbi:MAG: glycogen/starch synthase [Bacteroidaceae bacterium]|nr:glycogen/starch synthase [Bacteroidaceae bacterium]
MKAKRILFITQEITPYVAETPESMRGRKLPQQVQEKGREARTFMPKWGTINERRNQLHEVIRLSGMNLIIDDTDHPLIIKVASIPSARMQVYFIDNDDYFSRKQMGADARRREYKDNPERAVFYARGVLETVKKLRWVPDVVHCMGWMSAFVPLYIKTAYEEEPCFRDCSVIYTPSGYSMKGKLPKNFANIMRLRSADISALEGLEDTKDVQMLNKVGIKYADGISFMKSNEKLLQLAQSLNKPILEPQDPEEYGSAHIEFYDQVWGEGKPDNEEEND